MLLLTRRPGQAIIIQPGQGADLATPVGALFADGPIVVMVNRLIRDEVRLGITAHADLQILREEIVGRAPSKLNRLNGESRRAVLIRSRCRLTRAAIGS